MTTLREAALMALEALEDSCYPRASTKHVTRYDDAIDVLRKALDADSMASLPEPVAWRTFDGEGGYEFRYYQDNEEYQQRFIERNGEQYASWVEPLYTAPPKRKWQSLTDEEIKDIWCWDEYLHSYQKQMIEDIQAKLKEKNT